MLLLIIPFICPFFFLSNKTFLFFFVKDFSGTTEPRILKFGTMLGITCCSV